MRCGILRCRNCAQLIPAYIYIVLLFVWLTSASALGSEIADAAEHRDWNHLARLIDEKSDVNGAQVDGMTALHWSAFHENPSFVDSLIDAGAAIDAKTRYGVTPLSIACTTGNAKIVDALLRAGADAKARVPSGETVLMIAARTGKIESVQCLLAAGANANETEKNGQTALMWAAHEGHADVVTALIEAGANRDVTLKSGFSAMMFAARQGQIAAIEALLDAGVDVNEVMKPSSTQGRAPRRGMSALMLAVESGHFQLALRLVDEGADPNDQRSGYAPLHALSWVRKASRGDNVEGDPEPRGSGSVTSLQFVRRLVAAGADVNLTLKNGKAGKAELNPVGATPLLYAAKTADMPFIRLLIELGADSQRTNEDGTTPLLAAAGVGVKSVDEEAGTEAEVIEAIEYFLELGGDINRVNKNQESIIHGACYRSFPAVAQLLVDRGADPKVWNIQNKYGWTPLMIAGGKRVGSVKPSPPMIRVIEAALANH